MRTRIGSVVAPARLVACVLLPVWLAGCGALNPAFVDVLDPTGSSASIAVAPGHVVIAFSNNATIDERIISYLESDDGGNLVLTNAEKRSLRPLIRFRVLVTYTDGSRQIIEFLSGSRIVEPFYAGIAARDLDVPDLTNVVALCDVARVEFLPGAPIEVYVPTIIARFRFVAPTDQQESFFRLESTLAPQFTSLTVDTPVLFGNIAFRDQPAALDGPQCGSVVTIVVEGSLTVPFLAGTTFPSYDIEDEETEAQIGGRYKFTVGNR